MATTTSLLTAEQFWEYPSSRWCELIDGVPIEMSPPGALHARTVMTVAAMLRQAETDGLGFLLADAGFVLRRNPDLVRAPDVAFIRKERVPATGFPRAFWDVIPDLIVEIVSPGDTAVEVQTKIREWIEAGARMVWALYPDRRTVQVVRSLLDREELTAEDVLEGGDVIPGFSCRVAELFG